MHKTVREEEAHGGWREVGHQRGFQAAHAVVREVKQVGDVIEQAKRRRQQGTGYREVAEKGEDQIHISAGEQPADGLDKHIDIAAFGDNRRE